MFRHVTRQGIKRFKKGTSFAGTDAANRTINVSSSLKGEAQVTKDVLKEVPATFVQRQKKDQEVTVNFSEQKGPSEKKPDSGQSGHAEELKENLKGVELES